jgi:TPR repeat protein
MLRLKLSTIACMLMISPISAFAQDFTAGLEAYKRQDFETALSQWKPLAEQGHVRAQFALGAMYQEGQGVIQNYPQATQWYLLAAEQGHAGAQLGLGKLYFKLAPSVSKIEGERQTQIAHMWVNIAASHGDASDALHASAVDARKAIERVLVDSEIFEAQELARECVEREYKNCAQF